MLEYVSSDEGYNFIWDSVIFRAKLKDGDVVSSLGASFLSFFLGVVIVVHDIPYVIVREVSIGFLRVIPD